MDRLTACRACLAPDPYLFLPLGNHAPAQMLIKPEEIDSIQPAYALNAQVCLQCGLIEIADQIPPDFFRHYLYVPSGATTMQSHFHEFAKLLAGKTQGSGLIVDIGCNDGLLLAACNALGCTTLGIDPAANIAEMAKDRGVNVHVRYFDPETAAEVAEHYGKAKIIVATNTFNHIGDLHKFLRSIDILLSEDGTFVIEVPRAKELIDHNEFDNIYHEHVSEFSLLSVVKLGEFFDMIVSDVHRLPKIHGGSMRVFLTRKAASVPQAAAVQEMLDEELAGGMLEASTYQALVKRIDQIGTDLRERLTDMKAQGLKIAGYGASARGNTLITYFGIDHTYLDFIVDKNALKHGMYSPNTQIPIKPVSAIENENPDVLFVLAWNFFEEIHGQQTKFLNRGGKFVVPLPSPSLVSG